MFGKTAQIEDRSIWISCKSFSLPFCECAVVKFNQLVSSRPDNPSMGHLKPPTSSHTTLTSSIS